MLNALVKIAPPYSAEQAQTIKNGFTKLLNCEIEFEFVEDKSIIGGFIAYIDGKVYDSSLSSRLSDMHKSIKRR